MREKIEQDMKQLCNLAQKLGVSNAIAFDAKDVVVDERASLKCQVPLCDDYGVSLMCPPNVMPVADFVRILSKYRIAILLQVSCPIPPDMLQLIESEPGNVANLYQNKAFIASYNKSFTRAKKKLHEIVHRAESAAFSMSYLFATGFIGGSCRLCTECVTPGSNEPCRHPFQARPSMEAMGINVAQTAINAGLPFDMPPKETTIWNGLILVE
ncbi:hypothetical protein ES703_100459 [subsurface metagenome]